MCKFYKIFLPAVFKSCRFYMAEIILFIPKNACLHLVIHSKLVADERPIGYGTSIPLFIQFHNPQIEGLAYSVLVVFLILCLCPLPYSGGRVWAAPTNPCKYWTFWQYPMLEIMGKQNLKDTKIITLSASSLGNAPFFVTFRRLELTDSTAFVVYMTFLAALP